MGNEEKEELGMTPRFSPSAFGGWVVMPIMELEINTRGRTDLGEHIKLGVPMTFLRHFIWWFYMWMVFYSPSPEGWGQE